jgi:hypothetical protein
MAPESKGLMNNLITIIVIIVANVVISYIMTNKIASTMVIRDNLRIEYLENEMKTNVANIIKLDEHIIGKENFENAMVLLRDQNDITRQMIIAHERRNETEFIKLQNQYELLEKLFEKEVQRFRGTSVIGGQQISPQ